MPLGLHGGMLSLSLTGGRLKNFLKGEVVEGCLE